MTQPANRTTEFADHLAYFVCASISQNGWVPYRQLAVPVGDLGFRQSVTAVERLRTYGGQPFRVSEHLARFENTLRLIHISGVPHSQVLSDLITESLTRNASLLGRHGDVGITVCATPGSRAGDRTTLALHLNAIDHAATEMRRTQGQAVVLTDTVQPASTSWSRLAKVRCRLHYYLADIQAESLVDGATGVLQDSDGSWTESSIANIALLFGNDLNFAPAAQVLPGITQARVRELAHRQSLTTRETRLTHYMVAKADAMLLMGTDTGLWFAKSVHDARGRTILAAPSESTLRVIAALQSEFAEIETLSRGHTSNNSD